MIAVWALACGKQQTGTKLRNKGLMTEARVSVIDGALPGAVLIGVALNAAFGWWWADPISCRSSSSMASGKLGMPGKKPADDLKADRSGRAARTRHLRDLCALGIAGIPVSRRNRISLLMVTFAAGMPLIGVAIGAPLGHAIGETADYIAIAVLAAFGLYTLLADEDDERSAGLLDATGWKAITLGVSISLDELAVGFTLGLLRLPVLIVIAAIAAQTLVMTQLGMRLGARVGRHVQERAEQLAGAALITLAGVLLLEKLAT